MINDFSASKEDILKKQATQLQAINILSSAKPSVHSPSILAYQIITLVYKWHCGEEVHIKTEAKLY